MTSFTGTGRLLRLIVRRDRLRLVLWVGGLVTLMAVSTFQVRSLYDTPDVIAGYVRTAGDNPALVIFAGPGYGFSDPNSGVVLVNETSLWMALACALMSVFLVNRHTRAEEESERADLVRSTVVGRHAPLVAALTVAVAANVAVVIGSLIAVIGAGYPVAGAAALVVSFGGVGVCFAAVAAVAAQIAGTGRGTLGLAAGLTGLAFVVRGIGDISVPALAWCTPFGWAIGVRAFAGERWWPMLGLVGFTVTFTIAAVALAVRRDLGSGWVAPRAGRAEAAAWSTRPLGLAFRLQRGALLGWSVGLFLTGAVYGSVGDDVEQMLADNPELADYLALLGGVSIADAYLATATKMLAMVATGFALSSALRVRSEETAGFAESMLATSVSRWWWVGSHLVVTVVGTSVVVAAAGLGMGTGYAVVRRDGSQVGRLLGASLSMVPAVLVIVGLALVLFGWLPRWTTLAWGGLAVVVVVGIFGQVLRLPHWATEVSPLEHVPQLPAQPAEALPLVLLSLVAAALVLAGLVGFRRRDLAGA